MQVASLDAPYELRPQIVLHLLNLVLTFHTKRGLRTVHTLNRAQLLRSRPAFVR